jgi:hypothetical protein
VGSEASWSEPRLKFFVQPLVADVLQRVSVFSAVLGSCIIRVQARGDFASRREQAVFLLVEDLVSFGQQAIDLASGDVHAQLRQLFVQQRLRDLMVEVLIEQVAPQARTKVASEILGQWCDYQAAIRSSIAGSPITRVVSFGFQVLGVVILETKPLRSLGEPCDL